MEYKLVQLANAPTPIPIMSRRRRIGGRIMGEMGDAGNPKNGPLNGPGSTTWLRLVHPKNVSSFILSTRDGMLMVSKATQFLNAAVPMLLTLGGRIILYKLEHP